MPVAHCAKFSDPILDLLRDVLAELDGPVLDPFAGTGRIHELRDDTVGVELEAEWAALHERTIVGNALALPFDDASFGTICTSPTYGNRMADTYAGEPCRDCGGSGWIVVNQTIGWPYGEQVQCEPCGGSGRKPTRRYTYRLSLGRELSPDNSGAMQWGPKYRRFHEAAWREAVRVLRPGGAFVLNCSDHVRGGDRQYVTRFHVETLEELGLVVITWDYVPTSRMRNGANADLRVPNEDVVLLRKPEASS